jgi:hypothetical protein
MLKFGFVLDDVLTTGDIHAAQVVVLDPRIAFKWSSPPIRWL